MHLPTNPAETIRALTRRLGRALGRFSPMMREVAEMAYRWERPS